MKLKKWFENWELTKLKVSIGWLETEWQPQEADRDAAWELYVEMLTRITSQPLADTDGVEKTALDSVYALFGITREILRRKGRDCIQFSKIAVIVLNQIVRPFTAKWHKFALAETAFGDAEQRQEFRKDLEVLQVDLRKYTKALANIADVEDLTELAFD
ncbi:MAG: hypothetical protein WCP01_14745 [Methylococcaceae bacterium]